MAACWCVDAADQSRLRFGTEPGERLNRDAAAQRPAAATKEWEEHRSREAHCCRNATARCQSIRNQMLPVLLAFRSSTPRKRFAHPDHS